MLQCHFINIRYNIMVNAKVRLSQSCSKLDPPLIDDEINRGVG